MRHGKSVARKEWSGDDAQRPLTPRGAARSLYISDAADERFGVEFARRARTNNTELPAPPAPSLHPLTAHPARPLPLSPTPAPP
ncbi:hypothetical protein, partial [Bifidobacterium xylocopae]|uniref:hypothetical protein n=1 Tax=Bifidobacterium xylocopae TaxID=2493119 RepID=UPI001F19B3CE